MTSEHRARTQAACIREILSGAAAACDRGVPADHALAQVYRAHREFGSRDRRLFSSLAYAVFRWRGWLDFLGLSDPDERAVAAHFLEGLPADPAVAELAARTRFRDRSPPPRRDGPLEMRAADLAAWAGAAAPPPVDALLPAWSAGAIATPSGAAAAAHFRRCVEAFQRRPPLWLRVAPAVRDRALAILASAGLAHTPHAAVASAFALDSAQPVSSDVLSRLAGLAEVQDLASQAVGLVARPAPGSRWWDVCAGALGKSLQLAELMGGSGEVVATDIRASALDNGRRRRERARAATIRIREWVSDTGSAPSGWFDGVLVDAPCSAIGTWHRNPDARWRTSLADVAERAETQRRLLGIAGAKVRPGGALVYATCTLSAGENDVVIDSFLAGHPEFSADPFESPLDRAPAAGRLWIWPWEGPCTGMYIARLRRG